MNDILRAVVLGIVEGLTEVLPISSTGHMILVMPLLGIEPSDRFWNGAFDIFIQLGAILAVLIYFWRRLWPLAVRRPGRRWHEHILVKLVVAFLPAAVIGARAGDFIEEKLKNPMVVSVALIVGGIAILIIEAAIRDPKVRDAASISLMGALAVGLAQCLSMVPGTSRSAATIMGALLVGLSPAAAAEFSFFLAIPTMFAAGFYSLHKHVHQIESAQVLILGVGFAVAFAVAWVVIAGFMRFIQTHRFTGLAIYRIALGVIVLVVIARLSAAGG